MTRLYLYLREPEWVKPWVSGGRIPINPASFYRSKDRAGIYTPDENFLLDAWGDTEALFAVPGAIVLQPPPGEVPRPHSRAPRCNVHFTSGTIVGRDGKVWRIGSATARMALEDGLLLSMSMVRSRELANRLGDKKACVRIRNMGRLIDALNEQVGAKCEARRVAYTAGANRNHFLKSASDSWQAEFRLLWLTDEVKQRWVELPPDIAAEVKL